MMKYLKITQVKYFLVEQEKGKKMLIYDQNISWAIDQIGSTGKQNQLGI